MKKNIQSKNYRWILVVATVLVIALLFTACSASEKEQFYKNRKDVENVESSVLVELKEICMKAFEEEKKVEIKDEFIYVNFIDGLYTLQLHILTEKEEYLKYDIVSEEYGIELPYFVYTGRDVGAVYAMKSREVYEYLKYYAEAIVDSDSTTIYLRFADEPHFFD